MGQSFDDSKPIYIQVRERLEDMIIKKQIAEEEQSPSTTQMANFFKINHITVSKGVNQLVEEGILYKKRGIGMFVAEGAREKLLKKRKQTFVKEFVHPMLNEAEKLDLTEKEIKAFIEQEKRSK